MKSNKKSLVAYYLREGNNYVAGRIIYLPVGNTEVVAQKIQQLIRAELFEIKTLMDYPEDYTETTRVAQKELRENTRPKLSTQLNNLDSYDIISLAIPVGGEQCRWLFIPFLNLRIFLEKLFCHSVLMKVAD
jgi:flavodoxin